MPDYTITLNDQDAAEVQALVTRYNADNDALLDVAGFLQLHSQEIAIQRRLQAAHNTLAKQAEADVAAAIAATKERLLKGDVVAEEGA